MNNLQQTGIRISQYPQGPINNTSHRNKLELHHSFISWAPAYYGINTINKNYQVPLKALRQDITGYIGIDNSKPSWREWLTFWHGDWYNTDRTNSYVYEWKDEFIGHEDYIFNKHGKDTLHDKKNNIHRIFLLNDAPLPLEQSFEAVNPIGSSNNGIDPNPHTIKIVTKKYVDDRHNGVRKIEKTPFEQPASQYGSELKIRPYTCFYQYSNLPAKDEQGIHTINICDTQTLQDGRTIKQAIGHNRLMFYIRLNNKPEYYLQNGKHSHNLKLLVNGKEEVQWSYDDELSEILRLARPKTDNNTSSGNTLSPYKNYIFIRCQAEYIDDKFVVTCSNFWGRGKNTRRIVETEFQTIDGINQIDLKLSLHENESFITQIPQQQEQNVQQYYIKLDANDLNDYHEYTWNYYIVTPERSGAYESSSYDYDDIIFETGKTPIMWAMEDGYNLAPRLEPNKLYCFQFIKVFDNILIGRIKYFVNMIKKT